MGSTSGLRWWLAVVVVAAGLVAYRARCLDREERRLGIGRYRRPT